jgi:hypothetical protein
MEHIKRANILNFVFAFFFPHFIFKRESHSKKKTFYFAQTYETNKKTTRRTKKYIQINIHDVSNENRKNMSKDISIKRKRIKSEQFVFQWFYSNVTVSETKKTHLKNLLP